MRYAITVKPNAKANRVEHIGDQLKVWVKAQAKEGKANAAAERAVAEYLGVAPSRVRIIAGHASKRKLLEIT